MGKPSNGDTMGTTYTGCVVSVNPGGTFLLTKVDSVAAESMHGDMGMNHPDDMAMKGDAAKTMQHEQTPMADEKMDAMPSKSFVLAGSAHGQDSESDRKVMLVSAHVPAVSGGFS